MGKKKVEVYPNAPLRDVFFELKFPGDPAFECRRDEIFNLVKSSLPRVFVPHIPADAAVALQPYRFTSQDESCDVRVALNSLCYHTSKYPGFDEFRKEALGYLNRIGSRFKVGRLTRVGLRYVNTIPFVRVDGLIPLDSYLQLQVLIGNVPLKYQSIDAAFVAPLADGGMTTRIGTASASDTGIEALVLDFDYYMSGDLRFDKLDSYLEGGHTQTKKLFESLVTSDFRSVMRKKIES